MRAAPRDSSERVKLLRWGDEVELPTGLSAKEWTKANSGTKSGFVKSAHLVQVAYVKRKGRSDSGLQAVITTERLDDVSGETHQEKRKLLWGDLVQITKPGVKRCEVRARGMAGKMDVDDLTEDALLEVYFVDVGQGDGVLVRTPDGRHMLIDGGLERTKQQTGKNAADFVDWKFFFDYGDFRIQLDSLMASHSDNDHYGGLHDLVRKDELADRELDCVSVDVKTFHHPGLSRWTENKEADPKHKQGLGAHADGAFVQLLGDRGDAEKAVSSQSVEKLSGPWKSFIAAVLDNSQHTKVERVLLDRERLASSGSLPELWPSKKGCRVLVLGPVSRKVRSKPALPDFGQKSFNTNGHSICLRIDYGKARILLTGDLNSKSMNWLASCYGDRIGAWECDVAKACHHGSHDISYAFLEKMHAAATVISSGDAEGHSHPRPEIVGASAMAGFKNVDRDGDRLVTPLVYMTEIERSVSLGALNRIDFRLLPIGEKEVSGAILGRHVDELNDKAYLTPEDRADLRKIKNSADANKFLRKVRSAQKPVLQAMEDGTSTGKTRVDFNLTVSQGPVSSENVRVRAWRSRIMEKNHYGLVNVRTDGETILCATLDETEQKWVTHSFPARFASTED
jgi:beta-lactamase superfamily II metal-dependent hydrolase